MKFIITALLLLSATTNADTTVEGLLEDPARFVANHSTDGFAFYVHWSDASVAYFWEHGLPSGAELITDFNEALRLSEVDTDETRAVLVVDLNDRATDGRFLRYKKNRTHKHLRKIARARGLHYTDRPEVFRMLSDEHQVDAVSNDDDQIFLLKPRRFRLLSYAQTVTAFKLGVFGSPETSVRMNRVLARHRCVSLLEGRAVAP